MHRRIWFLLGLALLLGILFLSARFLTPWLVTFVVYHAVQQKAPDSVDDSHIQRVFETALSAVQNDRSRREAFVQELFRISQRTERVQQLTPEDTEEILNTVRLHERQPADSIP